MLEIKEAINIENKNPNSDMDSLNNIKENLINDINEEKEIKSNNKDNDSTEQEEKEEILSSEHLYINNAVNNQNKENKIKEEKFFDESSISSNKTEKIEDIFNTSKLGIFIMHMFYIINNYINSRKNITSENYRSNN